MKAFLLAVLMANLAEARVVKLRVERREPGLNGKSFGLAGPYEKLVGRVEFALDPAAAARRCCERSKKRTRAPIRKRAKNSATDC